MPLRVLHLVGSAESTELFELSCLYAAGCLDVRADRSRYDHVVALVFPDGTWRFPDSLAPASVDRARPLSFAGAVGRIAALDPDLAVPQMFCRTGMTHHRALLDLLGIPYVGNRPDVMATGAHKPSARAVVAAAGVRVPAGEVLRRGQSPTVATPAVVKPADADNSAGVTLVHSAADYPRALDAAFAHSAEVLVEEFVPLGREVRCGVLEQDGDLVVLPLEEYAVDPDHKPVRGAGDKLARDEDGRLRLVAKDAEHAWIVADGDPAGAAVAEAARACHRALRCRHYSLFDFRIDPAGVPWFLEASLYCSFAPSSVLVTMAAAGGTDAADLFARMAATVVPCPPVR